jgi:hypothetical protein
MVPGNVTVVFKGLPKCSLRYSLPLYIAKEVGSNSQVFDLYSGGTRLDSWSEHH